MGKLKDIYLKHRAGICIAIAFFSWMFLIVNQAHQFINNPGLTEGRTLHSMSEAFTYMLESTVIINLVVFLFPLSYILLVFGLTRKYNSIVTTPVLREVFIGLAICTLSFILGFFGNRIGITQGGFGVTEYLLFLFGISYLFFGYDKLRGFFKDLTSIFSNVDGDNSKNTPRKSHKDLLIGFVLTTLGLLIIMLMVLFSALNLTLSPLGAWVAALAAASVLIVYGLKKIQEASTIGMPWDSRTARFFSVVRKFDISLLFIVAMEIIYILYQTNFFQNQLIVALEPVEASFVGNVLHTLGYPVVVHGRDIWVQGLHGTASFTIAEGCTGIISMTIYSVLGSALILTVPSKAWKKATCIIGGVFLLFFANLLRLMTIVLIGYYRNQADALEFHTWGGYIYFMLFVGVYWYIALNYFLIEPRKKDSGKEKDDGRAIKQQPMVDKKVASAKKFTIDVSWVFSTILVSMIVGFVLKVMLVKHYGTNDEGMIQLGLYTLLLVVYMIAYTIGELGISATITKFVAESRDNNKLLKRYASTAFVNSMLNGIILCAVIFVLSGPLAAIFHKPGLDTMLRIVAFVFPFLAMNGTMMGIINGQRQMRKYGMCGIFRRIIVVIYTGIFILMNFDMNWAVVALVLAEVSTFILALYFLKGILFPLDLSRFRVMTRKMWGYSWAVVTVSILGQMEYRMDILVLAFFLDSKTIAIYGIAVTLAWFLPMIPRAIQSITFPMMARYHAKRRHKEMSRLVNLCLKFSLILMITLYFILIFLGQKILVIFFKETFIQAYTPMVILACGLIVWGTMSSIGSAFLSIGRPSESFKISMGITLPISIALNILLVPGVWIIPALGMNGAALAIAIAYIIGTTTYMSRFSKLARIDIMWRKLGVITLLAFASGTVVALTCIFISVFIAFTVGMVLFAIMLLVLKVVTPEERRLILGLVKSFF